MKARFTMTLISLGLLMLVFACSNMDDNTLATIDGNTVLLDDFTSKNPASRFAGKDHDFIDEKVDEFVRKALFTHVAMETSLGEEPEIIDKKMKAEKRQLIQYVYNKVILESVISDDFLKEMYDRTGTELNAKHILISFEGTDRARTARTKTDALAIMGQINNRLSSGESFEDLAGEFTDDPTGKENGGDLGWFGWGKMVGPFQDAAFSLNPGEVSDVVETSFGLHIIKLEAKRTVERGSFEEEKNALKQQASREKSAELGARANQFLTDQKNNSGFEVIPENVTEFFEIFNASTIKQAPFDDVLNKLNYSKPLFVLFGKDEGSEWISEELSSLDNQQKPRITSENSLLSVLENMVVQHLIVAYGYDQKFEQDPEFASRINDLVERYAYDAFVAQNVNEDLTPSDEELMSFYESTKTEKYMDKSKVQVREVFVKDSLLAVALKKRMDAGELIDLLARRYTERKTTKEDSGLLPAFQEGRYGLMGKAAFSMEVGEIAGPIKLGNGYSIIKLEQIIPEGPKPYNKVKARVRTEILSELRKKRTADIYNTFKKDYPVKVNYAAAYAFYDKAATK